MLKVIAGQNRGRRIIFPFDEINARPTSSLVKESVFKRPDIKEINKFKDYLIKNNLSVTIRRELGKDISGSCGQLRASVK